MIDKVLVANRGEIACRIMRTLNRLEIPSVAVYSEVDATAPHVGMATESVCIGPGQALKSYLNPDAIFDAVKSTGANAIHPGYGFFSENAGFAHKVFDAGLVWIGPKPEVIEAMGDKSRARDTMKEAGVPVVPGSDEAYQDMEAALTAAESIGFPVLLKPATGGGGIGMSVCQSSEELQKKFPGVSKRSGQLFGDPSVYIEKLIVGARHIEVQVVGDQMGVVRHLGERECSVQRRHQKVLEEAPSPAPLGDNRKALWEAAVKGAHSIGYDSAGTLEFLVDQDNNFYFIEMNTRLQVEHPVTEEVHGVDLVEAMLEVASGKPVPFDDASDPSKWSIEARIYAENPDKKFMPSPGDVTKLVYPEGEGIRNELGIHEGYKVTPFYDPMVAKVVATGDDRLSAIDRLAGALDGWTVETIKTNIPLLLEVLEDSAFREGTIHTKYLEEFCAARA